MSAFTIMELSIAMLISAIVVATSYTSYLVISSSYRSYTQKSSNMQQFLTLKHLIEKDFGASILIVRDSVGITACFPDHRVTYRFDTNRVLRVQLRTDTFNLRIDSASMLFESRRISRLAIDSEQNRIDELHLAFRLRGQTVAPCFYKLYSSENLITRR